MAARIRRAGNWRMTPEDEKIMAKLMEASGRGPTFIVRQAIRKLTVEDLMRPLLPVGEAEREGVAAAGPPE